MTERRLSINLADLEAAFEDASDVIHYYLDLQTGQVVAIGDEIRDELDAICEELDKHGVDDDALAAALERRDLPAWMREAIDEAHQVERGYGARYIAIPTADSHEGYHAMEDFIETVADRRLQAQLVHAIKGRGAFRRFKDVLLSYPDEREHWFAFSAAQVRQRVQTWLAEEGIEVVTEAGEAIRPLVDREQEENG